MANYHAGRRFEWEIADLFKREGYTVSRTAGSHGEFDLLATKRTSRNRKRIFLVVLAQCKRTQR